jgi:hypothetical protein
MLFLYKIPPGLMQNQRRLTGTANPFTNVASMDNVKPNLVTKQGAIIDLILTVIFYVWIVTILKKHVPWQEASETAIWLGAAYCGACLAGVLWMALSLFRVTLADQVLQKAEASKYNR